jgi:hypothetical protein
MAKKYPKSRRGAKILTALQFRKAGIKNKSLMGGDAFGYNLFVKRNENSRAFGKRGLQELADTERKRRYK